MHAIDYFSKPVRDALPGWRRIEDDLRLLGEPSFLRFRRDEIAFRLLWGLPFRAPLVLRVERAGELCLGILRQKTEAGYVEREVILSTERTQWLAEAVDGSFWGAAVDAWDYDSLEEHGKDGHTWVLEAARAGRY